MIVEIENDDFANRRSQIITVNRNEFRTFIIPIKNEQFYILLFPNLTSLGMHLHIFGEFKLVFDSSDKHSYQIIRRVW